MGDSLSEAAGFPGTRRSAVLGAASDDPIVRERSWRALVEAYWKPAYKHVRVKWKAQAPDAADHVQAFFERAVHREFFAGYQPERARFRTFFKLCLDRHVSSAGQAAAREKRGGLAAALDFADAERELELAGAAAWESPEEVFEREFKRALFGRGVQALEAWCRSEGKPQVWEAFRRYDLGDPPRPKYDALASELSLPVTTITNHLALARRKLKELVLGELQLVTASDGELREEVSEAGLA
jgi:DNA-directed RNA polymerase specialized sigma24 family protein